MCQLQSRSTKDGAGPARTARRRQLCNPGATSARPLTLQTTGTGDVAEAQHSAAAGVGPDTAGDTVIASPSTQASTGTSAGCLTRTAQREGAEQHKLELLYACLETQRAYELPESEKWPPAQISQHDGRGAGRGAGDATSWPSSLRHAQLGGAPGGGVPTRPSEKQSGRRSIELGHHGCTAAGEKRLIGNAMAVGPQAGGASRTARPAGRLAACPQQQITKSCAQVSGAKRAAKTRCWATAAPYKHSQQAVR